MAQFSIHQPGFRLINSIVDPQFGYQLAVGVDGISLWLVVLTGLITPPFL